MLQHEGTFKTKLNKQCHMQNSQYCLHPDMSRNWNRDNRSAGKNAGIGLCALLQVRLHCVKYGFLRLCLALRDSVSQAALTPTLRMEDGYSWWTCDPHICLLQPHNRQINDRVERLPPYKCMGWPRTVGAHGHSKVLPGKLGPRM